MNVPLSPAEREALLECIGGYDGEGSSHEAIWRAATAWAYEQAAKRLDDAAIGLIGGRTRRDHVDSHAAEVLRRHATAIRAMIQKDTNG